MNLDPGARRTLLDSAWQVLECGVFNGTRAALNPELFATQLQQQGASFITLSIDSRLRGCCGTVRAHQSLIEDVVDNAWRTAFVDPRFEPLNISEFPGLRLEISVLSPMRRIAAGNRQLLVSALEPGRHGLLIKNGDQRATFLPKVWESLSSAEDFLQQLRIKAGMPLDHWPDCMEAFTYTTQMFGEGAPG